ncbi:MAG: DUF2909 domain-containing protein [Gammaproteobacteria bacterium]
MVYLILLTAFAMVCSLCYGFYAFIQGQLPEPRQEPEPRQVQEQGRGKRLLNSLKLRVGLALLLMLEIIFGLATGQLQVSAPWDQPVQPIPHNQLLPASESQQ